MRVAIQGELGSFSHEAAISLIPGFMVAVPCTTAFDVLRTLECEQADAAVIPIENSLAGSVIDFYDLFFEHAIAIQHELQMRIRHNLIAPSGSTLDGLRRVLSHPIALAQCKRFFAAHPHLEPVGFYDTAGSVQHVMETKDLELAAIAGKQAAAQYKAAILIEGIEDHEENYTRFWLIRRRGTALPESTPTRLSLVFLLENRPGALLQALNVFAARQMNLTKIESRPMAGRPWEYMFYADVSIASSHDADAALGELNKMCPLVKELGRYDASKNI